MMMAVALFRIKYERPWLKSCVVAVVLCAAIAIASCSNASTRIEGPPAGLPTEPSPVPTEGNVPITRVRAFIKDGQPQVFVQGELGDGCNALQGITQRRTANTFDISVRYSRQGEVCTMIMQLLNEWVPLSGSFGPGEYTVQTNGYTTSFHLVSGPTGLRIDPDPGSLPGS
jgi:hypothetical protein